MASKNEEIILQSMESLKEWASVGIPEREIADKLGMSYSTFRSWKKKIPALSALFEKTPDEKQAAKEKRTKNVEGKLYDRCIGYNAKVKKHIKVKQAARDKEGNLLLVDGKPVMEENVIEVTDEQHVPADVGAQKFYLMNQARKDWKSDPEKLAHDSQRVKNDTKRTKIAENNAKGQSIEGKTVEDYLEEAERAAECAAIKELEEGGVNA